MYFEYLHTAELTLMERFQVLRSPILDQFMIWMNFFDTSAFYFTLLAVIWYGYSPRCGKRLLYLLVLNVLVLQNLKELFSEPRPCQLMPDLALLTASSHGFPSGAAQEWVSIYLFFGSTLLERWFWLAGALMVSLVCLSRVYLGLHFPSDIAGGLVFGLLTFALFWKSLPKVEAYLQINSKPKNSTIVSGIFAVLYSISLNSEAANTMLFGWSASLGIIWITGRPKRSWKAVVSAIAGFLVLQVFTHSPWREILGGFWISSIRW